MSGVRRSPEAAHRQDDQGQLRVGAAVGTGPETPDRIAALVKAGVDVVIVDTAHGHSKGVIDRVRWAKETFPELTVHKEVSFVHDGKLLTSVGGAKSFDVALYLVHHLYGEKVAKGVGRGLVIDWDLADYEFVRVEQLAQ